MIAQTPFQHKRFLFMFYWGMKWQRHHIKLLHNSIKAAEVILHPVHKKGVKKPVYCWAPVINFCPWNLTLCYEIGFCFVFLLINWSAFQFIMISSFAGMSSCSSTWDFKLLTWFCKVPGFHFFIVPSVNRGSSRRDLRLDITAMLILKLFFMTPISLTLATGTQKAARSHLYRLGIETLK